MSYEHSQYAGIQLDGAPAPVGVFDYANSKTETLAAGTAQDATALPAGCYMARIAAHSTNSGMIHIRGDGTAATTDAPPLAPGNAAEFVVTAADRQFSLIGTTSDKVTITPYLVTYTSVADQA